MSQPFVAQIKIFGGNFAPIRWAFCDGRLFPIAQNAALFKLIRTTYGGDGLTTMGLPDLRGRAVMHPGRGRGLTPRRLGERGGMETVALSDVNQISEHTHRLHGTSGAASNEFPSDQSVFAAASEDTYTELGGNLQVMARTQSNEQGVLNPQGGGQPHNNMQPYIVLNYIISLAGHFPSPG